VIKAKAILMIQRRTFWFAEEVETDRETDEDGFEGVEQFTDEELCCFSKRTRREKSWTHLHSKRYVCKSNVD
jgi:hypothetical protein